RRGRLRTDNRRTRHVRSGWPGAAQACGGSARHRPARLGGEESFQAGKGLAGLDQHQVRRWNSWHHWTTLAMLASAFLAVLAATERARQPPPDGMIPLISSE